MKFSKVLESRSNGSWEPYNKLASDSSSSSWACSGSESIYSPERLRDLSSSASSSIY